MAARLIRRYRQGGETRCSICADAGSLSPAPRPWSLRHRAAASGRGLRVLTVGHRPPGFCCPGRYALFFVGQSRTRDLAAQKVADAANSRFRPIHLPNLMIQNVITRRSLSVANLLFSARLHFRGWRASDGRGTVLAARATNVLCGPKIAASSSASIGASTR